MCKVQGWRTGENPAQWHNHLSIILPRPKKVSPTRHRAAMPWQDIPAFVTELRTMDDPVAMMLEFTILTAVRAGPVLQATWSKDEAARIAMLEIARHYEILAENADIIAKLDKGKAKGTDTSE